MKQDTIKHAPRPPFLPLEGQEDSVSEQSELMEYRGGQGVLHSPPTYAVNNPFQFHVSVNRGASSKTIRQAQSLRKNMTDAENRLWWYLRECLREYRFRRQHAIGQYIADFVCLRHKLIIELDGGQHAKKQQADAHRTPYLEQLGFRVIRFWNNDVMQNSEGVLQVIYNALNTPSLPLKGEEDFLNEPVKANLENPVGVKHNRQIYDPHPNPPPQG